MIHVTNGNVVAVLNKQVANWNVLFVKLHNFHWYVQGPQFFTLHAKFEELYNEAATYVDELAERILALHGKPVATMKEYLDMSTVKESSSNESAEEMVQILVSDFSALIQELRQGMDVANEANDETTADMLLAIHTSLEKHVWMLNAFLK
ncbi:DNA starvation/stationary phase protection protein [Ectobacillus antri]|uniref:DNA starvation/stationary phase protection protein n=1 Tax=Ectobacillus antri TaxID=2486280 RepID=A0ABT6H0Y5_9BACI|nr:Dps family protein [Ectobacillus antri]MDG4656252.1 DNA starvation/stationary phase protection protein [Ectobacillus antri]MDG5752927.1 DNA starvation/stationary phase protection protein [Ectobacillus antri]